MRYRSCNGYSPTRTSLPVLSFTDSVGALAEEQGHHPRIVTEWGRVTVTWWTHKIRNLHRNDFRHGGEDRPVVPAGGVSRAVMASLETRTPALSAW